MAECHRVEPSVEAVALFRHLAGTQRDRIQVRWPGCELRVDTIEHRQQVGVQVGVPDGDQIDERHADALFQQRCDFIDEHFRAVAESTSLAVVLYNNPATCGGLSIEPDTVAKLAEIPNIIGIKDSSGDLQNTIEIIRRVPATFSVLNGRDTLIAAALMFGAKGAIPASCNIAPEVCVGIYESFANGDFVAAQKQQAILHPIRLAMSLGTGNGAIKEAMALIGRSAGPNRRPISPLSADKKNKLKAILTAAGYELIDGNGKVSLSL